MIPLSNYHCWLLPITIFVFVISTNHRSHGQLNVPNRPLGFVYKPTSTACRPPVTLSFYIDNTCDDSQAAYPTMIQVANHFGPQKVQLVSHLLSLPYHRNSHTIAKAAHVIDSFTNGAATYDWFKIIYDNLNVLTTSATAKFNDEQVMNILVPLAKNVSEISAAQFIQQVQERSVDLDARLGFKYGCTRGVYATPTFMVNDVIVSADPTWTVNQWIDLIQPLLN